MSKKTSSFKPNMKSWRFNSSREKEKKFNSNHFLMMSMEVIVKLNKNKNQEGDLGLEG